MSDQSLTKEELILSKVKQALTLVIKDTATQPGLKHPLADNTIINMRECLGLISEREQELATLAGKELNMRPHFIDEPVKKDSVVVEFDFKTDQDR
ncbi:hypothetical protein MNBD_GAMMA12-2451 [hydrothermal vent metagenome]|uniref:Segregation and condensation protein A n=1 Tax=hydrothermal vent metagenome TaxID=652676 RepID=A0A3B0Z2I1_9ZZZZ